MVKETKQNGSNCIICHSSWKKGQVAITCSSCNKKIHGPVGISLKKNTKQKNCSLLSLNELKILTVTESAIPNWICPLCTTKEIPFNGLSNNDLFCVNKPGLRDASLLTIIPDESTESFIDECNSLSLDFNDNIDQFDLSNNINSKYYTLHQFNNNIRSVPNSTLGMCHTNIASLSKHIEELRETLVLLKHNFQIIGLTEHKIRKDIDPVVNIDIEGYRPFIYNPTETTHGGTGFYISNSLNYKRRDDLNFNSKGDFESTFIEIIIPNKKNIIVGCVYRHPSSKISISDFTAQYIEPLLNTISTEDKLCSIMGDFNIDLLKRDRHENISEFHNLLNSYFFAPYVMQPTRLTSKTLIDNIFVNSVEYQSYSGNITIQLSDHCFQFVLFEGFFKEILPKKVNIYERNFKFFNEREFGNQLVNLDWDSILCLNDNDPNVSTSNLYNSITYLLDEFAPFRKIAKKELKLKSKPWINGDILSKMEERDKLLHKYRIAKDENLKSIIYDNYKVVRNLVTKLKRDAKIAYYKEFFETHKEKSSDIWKGIKSIVRINSTSRKDITLLDFNGKNVTDPKLISNIFNNFFVNIGPNLDRKISKSKIDFRVYLKNIKLNKTFFLNPTTSQEILDIINSLDNKKSIGPNSIPVFIIKLYQNFFSENLSKIINLSFITGIFPDLCKLAKVIPLFKKDNEMLCENYRPISLLPIFSKIFEKAIYTRMYEFLTKNDLLYNRQFGFRSNHSTSHALTSLTEGIKSDIDKGLLTAGIFIDLQKAFDTVNHKILGEKLIHYGFRGLSHKLLVSFLENRKQFVSIKGFDSETCSIMCGVPQGSTLGPLLFLLYINDFRYSLKKTTSSHFADDTCIIYANQTSSNKIKTLETILNTELKCAVDWLKANRLSLNVKKSKLLIFHSKRKKIDYESFSIKLGGSKLTPVKNVKYLGVMIDNFLSWDDHIIDLSKALSRSNGILAKLRHYIPKKSLLTVYYAIFHSKLLYGSLVWSQSTSANINKIVILQKKCLRIMNFADFNSHTNDLFKDCQIPKVNDVICNELLKFAFDFMNNRLPIDLCQILKLNINRYNTRNMESGGLVVPRIDTTSYGIRSLRYAIPTLWNDFIKSNKDHNLLKSNTQVKQYLKRLALKKYET